ncbi:hypothetical protein J2Y38_001758 [Flavobacterium sp. 2755]|nr:hypothetical protein [Flavobacterium sp. 2755]
MCKNLDFFKFSFYKYSKTYVSMCLSKSQFIENNKFTIIKNTDK